MDTQRYKIALEAELTEVIKMLSEIAVRDPNDEHNWVPRTDDIAANEPDPIDVADKTEEWVDRTGEVAQLESRYNNIKRALTKIEEGTFGICEICNMPIGGDRLDANPAARTCALHREEEGTLSR